MDRLTIRNKYGDINPPYQLISQDEEDDWNSDCRKKLAYYEDLEESGRLKILPCDIGDTLYLLDHECTEGMKYNCEIDGIMEGYLCRTCGTYPCTLHPSVQEVVVDSIKIIKDNTMVVELTDLRDVMIENFGKSVFLTREEAENKLKEME